MEGDGRGGQSRTDGCALALVTKAPRGRTGDTGWGGGNSSQVAQLVSGVTGVTQPVWVQSPGPETPGLWFQASLCTRASRGLPQTGSQTAPHTISSQF